MGRVFGEADDKPGATQVAVIAYPYWKSRFSGEPSAIGRVVSINGQMVTVIGVTGPDFSGMQRALAGYLPALRASNVDPMEASRQQ